MRRKARTAAACVYAREIRGAAGNDGPGKECRGEAGNDGPGKECWGAEGNDHDDHDKGSGKECLEECAKECSIFLKFPIMDEFFSYVLFFIYSFFSTQYKS